MAVPALTIEEQHNIDNGPCLAKLSPALRREILERSALRVEPTRLVALLRVKLLALFEPA